MVIRFRSWPGNCTYHQLTLQGPIILPLLCFPLHFIFPWLFFSALNTSYQRSLSCLCFPQALFQYLNEFVLSVRKTSRVVSKEVAVVSSSFNWSFNTNFCLLWGLCLCVLFIFFFFLITLFWTEVVFDLITLMKQMLSQFTWILQRFFSIWDHQCHQMLGYFLKLLTNQNAILFYAHLFNNDTQSPKGKTRNKTKQMESTGDDQNV